MHSGPIESSENTPNAQVPNHTLPQPISVGFWTFDFQAKTTEITVEPNEDTYWWSVLAIYDDGNEQWILNLNTQGNLFFASTGPNSTGSNHVRGGTGSAPWTTEAGGALIPRVTMGATETTRLRLESSPATQNYWAVDRFEVEIDVAFSGPIPVPVPEPTMALVLLTGLGGLAARRGRRA